MAHEPMVTALKQAIEPLLGAERMALVDLHWGRRGKRWALTLFIDKEGGVTLDDCERISWQVGELIEVDSLIGHAYILEVSSPGLDRPLRTLAEFERFRGHVAKITTTNPVLRRYTLLGRLRGIEAQSVLLEVERQGIVPIPLAQIKHARLEVEV